MRFLNTLPFLKAFILGRADYSAIMKTAIVEETVMVKRDRKQQFVKTMIDFKWEERHQQAFDIVKQAVLDNVNSEANDNRQYHLCTDASKTGAGGVLFQLSDSEVGIAMTKELWSQLSIIVFMSYQFTPTQTRYHTIERECLAVVKSLDEVRWIVKDSKYPVMLYTDYQALLKVLKSKDITGRILRWQLALSEYDLDIYYVLGKNLAVANDLSRIEKYPSRIAIDEESTMTSFAAEVTTDYQSTARSPTRHPGDHTHRSEDVPAEAMTNCPLTAGRQEDVGNGTPEQAKENTSWELDW